MTADNIEIASFITILQGFQKKGAIVFGMDILNNGKHITLYPVRIEKDDKEKEEDKDEGDENLPIKDLQA